MSITVRRTTNADPAFDALVRQLDAELWERYGDVQGQYVKFNVLVTDTAVVAFDGDDAVGCGCFKLHGEPAGRTVELKRVFVPAARRGRGIARAMVAELEAWARELGHATVVLETGTLQVEAIAMYERLGYERIDPFPPYDQMPASICMRKQL